MCQGFKAAGIASGLKKNGMLDLGLIVSDTPAAVAGVFTRNRVQAAPVLLCKNRIQSGTSRAVIANSGNANCCTGDQGMADAVRMARLAAGALGIAEDQVLPASTGVIGQPLAVAKIEAALPALAAALSPDGLDDFARAIMTTDTTPKMISRQGSVNGKTFTVTAVAKGAGMICPNMATMLCFVLTDIAAAHGTLQPMLAASVDKSFNRITIDGDTSTNDTVLILANGMSGISLQAGEGLSVFQEVLDMVLIDLAKMVVKDGEGATKLVEIVVKAAASEDDAKKIVFTVANSNLVKTALFGQDANWGRIFAAAGRSGAVFNPEAVDIWFDDIRIVKDGLWAGSEAEQKATLVLHKPEFGIIIDLKTGTGNYSGWTCDFSIDYVKINADYRS
jgi:glutamate N-acetyltransferase / amino-acid N-acetyltransferase